MARLKSSIPGRGGAAGAVPEQLQSRLHPMWLDDAAIRRFCDQHALDIVGWQGPLTAFKSVAEAYAVAQGWIRTFGGGAHTRADLDAMRAAGIPVFSGRLEAQERRSAMFPDHRMTDENWEWIAGAEQRVLTDD